MHLISFCMNCILRIRRVVLNMRKLSQFLTHTHLSIDTQLANHNFSISSPSFTSFQHLLLVSYGHFRALCILKVIKNIKLS